MPLKGGSGQQVWRVWVETCRKPFKVGGTWRSPKSLLQIHQFGMGMASHSQTLHVQNTKAVCNLGVSKSASLPIQIDQFWFGLAVSMKDTGPDTFHMNVGVALEYVDSPDMAGHSDFHPALCWLAAALLRMQAQPVYGDSKQLWFRYDTSEWVYYNQMFNLWEGRKM